MLLGSLLCLLAVTAWGFMFPVMANALQFIDPFFFTTIRYISSYCFSYSVITYRRDKVTPLRKENTFVTLLRNSRFRRVWFSRFYGQQLAGPSGAIHAAMIQSLMPLIALLLQWITKINAHKTTHSFVCLLHYSVLCLSFQKEIFTYYLELPVTSQQIYLCYAALLAGSFIQTVVLIFNLGHHSDIRR